MAYWPNVYWEAMSYHVGDNYRIRTDIDRWCNDFSAGKLAMTRATTKTSVYKRHMPPFF